MLEGANGLKTRTSTDARSDLPAPGKAILAVYIAAKDVLPALYC